MRRWLETVTRARLAASALAAVALLGGAGWMVEVELLLGLSGLVGVAGIGAVGWRSWADALPLQLGRVAVRLELNGHKAFQVRAMLGRGRALRAPVGRARWLPEAGPPIALRVVGPGVASLVGPWTVLVLDEHDAIAGPGALEVEIEGAEAGRQWAARGRWTEAELVEARLVSAVRRQGGAVGWDAAGWDAAQA